jgi:hypothetical protein
MILIDSIRVVNRAIAPTGRVGIPGSGQEGEMFAAL